MADETAQAADLGPQALSLQAPEVVQTPGQLSLEYSDSNLDIDQQIGAKYDEQMKVWKHQGKMVLPQQRAKGLVTHLHRWTHLGHKKLKTLLQREGQTYYIPKLPSLIQQVTVACVPCTKVNAKHLKMPEGTRIRGERPRTNWEVDFTEIKPGKYGNKYLLVFIDTFSGWTEAFLTKRETAQVVVKKILEEIFPQFGLPKVIGSDNGPAFISQVSQLVARLLGINWKLHCAYRPQSSGQVERMNRTIKETLTKLTLETGTRDWVQLLPMVLFRLRNTPTRHGLTPYEILYGGPPPVTDLLDSAIDPLANTPGLQDRLKALQIIQCQIWKLLAAVYRPGDTTDPHPFQIGDSIYVRRHQSRTLEPRWKGPYTVLLTTPTALKVDGTAAWVHASHVKRAPSTSTTDASQDGPGEPLQRKLHCTQNPFKIRLSKIIQ
ncbi:Pol polyprotein (Fragment) [Vulpes lagopus]